MNDNTIESIEWHKNQLNKLINEDDFYKIESELNEILEKAKTKKKILVHRGGKTFYREQEVGRKEESEKYVPKMSDINFDLFASDMKEAIDDSRTDTMDNIDEYDIYSYVQNCTPDEYNLRDGTQKLRDEFEKKLYETFTKKYIKK